MPTNTLDLLERERRWCQGNLQHMRLLAWPGLKPASRAHLAFGIGGYLVVPIWWTFLLGGALRVLVGPAGSYGLLAYGATEGGGAAALLFTGSLVLIVAPRLLSLVCAIAPEPVRRGFGGSRRLIASAAVEQVAALLLGPVFALACATFVVEVLSGQQTGWGRQARADRRVALREAWQRQLFPICLGGLLLGAAVSAGGWYAVWMAPTVLGLAFSPWVTWTTSRADLGHWSRRLGLFTTQDDVFAPAELRELHGEA
jgi:membrane glycosyltransferase